jgi:membrane protease YdiL (CAAX protease family)
LTDSSEADIVAPETGTGDLAADAVAPGAGAAPASPALPASGRSTFSLEGRAVPALYLIGWVGSVMGLSLIAVSLLASGSAGAPWVMLGGLVALGIGVVAAAGSQAVERSRRTDLAYRGPSPVLAFAAAIALTLVGVVLVLAPLSLLGLDAGSPAGVALSLAVTALVYVAVVRLLVVGTGALSWAEMGLHGRWSDAARELVVGAMLAVPVLGVTLLLGGVLVQFLEPAPGALPRAEDSLGLLANLLTAAVLAPLGEELFFRGFATTAWARTNGPRRAIVMGAVFFAIAHILPTLDASFAVGAQRALFSFLALLPVALTLGWVFLARGSLYAAIGLHAAFNGLQVLLLFAAPAAV